jgi:hypothetical protein
MYAEHSQTMLVSSLLLADKANNQQSHIHIMGCRECSYLIAFLDSLVLYTFQLAIYSGTEND